MKNIFSLELWMKKIYMAAAVSILMMPLAHSKEKDPSKEKNPSSKYVDPSSEDGTSSPTGIIPLSKGTFPSAFDWLMGGHDVKNSRNQPSTTVTPQNAANLQQKWVFTAASSVSATPAVASNVAYFPDYSGYFYAVSAIDGSLIWSHKLQDWTGIANDYARNDPAVYNGMVILGDQGGVYAAWNGSQWTGPGARVMAVNASTGSPVWVTQAETFPSAIITSSPVVYNGIVYVGVASAEEGLASVKGYPCCTFRGSLVALNAQTGAKLWQTYTVPDNHGALGGYSGGAIWGATPAIDAARNSVYIGTGNNYSVPAAATACIKATPNNVNCTAGNDYFDSVLAMDLNTGAIKWASRAMAYDTWNEDCFYNPPGVGNCPSPQSPDYDFGGSGPNLFTLSSGTDLLGIGEKSGIYYALNPDSGSTVWSTQVGPGASLGGIEWGTATDGNLIYVPISNADSVTYALQPSGTKVNSGSWAALNPATGSVLWQTATPGLCSMAASGTARGCAAFGPASVANGVVFAGSMDTNPANPTMFALSAATGKVLWSFAPGSSVGSAPAIVGNTIFWGTGYNAPVVGGITDNRLFAFSVN